MGKVSAFAVKLAATALIASFAWGLDAPSNKIVDVAWVKANLNDKNLVLVDIREGAQEYEKGHIKGAVKWLLSNFREERMGVPGYIAAPHVAQTLFRHSGITENSVVVFYNEAKHDYDFSLPTTALLMAEYYGFEKTAVLNGGYDAWVAAGGEIEKGREHPTPSDFTIKKFNRDIVATTGEIDEIVTLGGKQLIDVRDDLQFDGKKAHPKSAKVGHIAGAKHFFIYELCRKDSNGAYHLVLDKNYINERAARAGVDLSKPQVWYCNTGWDSTMGWFITKYVLGYKNVYNKDYDASLVEYTRLPSRDVVKGK